MHCKLFSVCATPAYPNYLLNLRPFSMRPLLFFLGIVLFASCKLDKVEPVPGFMKIDTLTTNLNYTTQGSNSNNFTEAWVYVDGQLVGVYDTPALFPVLESGARTITVQPGIKRDGLASTRVPHPHFKNWEIPGDIPVNDTLSIRPVFQLEDAVKVWYEDFESEGYQFINVDGADTSLERIVNTPDVFEGEGSGRAFLDGEFNRFIIQTTENFQFDFGTPVFLEFDYKIDGLLTTTLIGHTNDGDLPIDLVFVPSKTNENNEAVYNKIYINLSTAIGQLQAASSYDIQISGSSLEATNQNFYLDNVKILYF